MSSITESDDIMQEIMARHLSIFKGDAGELILSGKKTVDSRFARRRIPPFEVVSSGDIVYIKRSGKDIIGQFKVKRVIFFDFGEIKETARYGTLIFIGESSRFITSPIKLKKKDSRGWVVLG